MALIALVVPGLVSLGARALSPIDALWISRSPVELPSALALLLEKSLVLFALPPTMLRGFIDLPSEVRGRSLRRATVVSYRVFLPAASASEVTDRAKQSQPSQSRSSLP